MKTDWQPIELELVRDEFLARVTRDRVGSPPRWRWSVTPLEVVQRWRSKVVENAYARGYSRSRARAVKMAERAVLALSAQRKADEKQQKEEIET